ncbi:DUF6089 family protein [Rapidithrix thailandica]|uniref:DUF6089 family protein n=1 Tax=Rapidithrix thailandica TaxID=413964 RepID=A0AAW9RZ42_9BACT
MVKRVTLVLSFFAAFLIINSQQAQAQWSLVGGVGATNYSGDISGVKIDHTRPALSLDLWYAIHPYFRWTVGVGAYQLYAKDTYEQRNRTFRANHYELNTTMMFIYDRNVAFAPYAYAGVGITKVDPEGLVEDPTIGDWWFNIAEHEPENASIPGHAFIIPVGVGVRYRFSPQFAVLLDGGLRISTSDFIDGVSNKNINVSQLSGNARTYHEKIRPHGFGGKSTIRGGNPDVSDFYGIVSLKLQYIPRTYGHNSEYLRYRKRGKGKFRRRAGYISY